MSLLDKLLIYQSVQEIEMNINEEIEKTRKILQQLEENRAEIETGFSGLKKALGEAGFTDTHNGGWNKCIDSENNIAWVDISNSHIECSIEDIDGETHYNEVFKSDYIDNFLHWLDNMPTLKKYRWVPGEIENMDFYSTEDNPDIDNLFDGITPRIEWKVERIN